MPKADKYPLRERRSLEERAKSEPDPDYRRFFLEVEYKRAALREKVKKSLVFCEYEQDGEVRRVVRPRAEPEAVKKFLKLGVKRAGGSRLAEDLEWLRGVWPKLVGGDVASETAVFAFKNGVVTVVVYTSSLLQEIRQFHQDGIFQDLRDVWQGSMPLVEVRYKAGGRK